MDLTLQQAVEIINSDQITNDNVLSHASFDFNFRRSTTTTRPTTTTKKITTTTKPTTTVNTSSSVNLIIYNRL